jgi:hypothetical protein
VSPWAVAVAARINADPVLAARLSLIVNNVGHATILRSAAPRVQLACSILDQVGALCVRVWRLGIGTRTDTYVAFRV